MTSHLLSSTFPGFNETFYNLQNGGRSLAVSAMVSYISPFFLVIVIMDPNSSTERRSSSVNEQRSHSIMLLL